MSLVTTALQDYVAANKAGLIGKTILGGRTMGLINVQTGIQGKATLNTLSTSVTFGDGTACGWDDDAVATVSERELEVTALKVNQSFCEKKLYGKAANYDIRMSAIDNALPFEEVFTSEVVKEINKELEKCIWQGKQVATPTTNLGWFDGFVEILGTATGVIKPTGVSGVKASVEVVYKAIPVDVLDKAAIFMSVSDFREYVLALSDENLYHYNPTIDGEYSVIIPGTNTKVYGIVGLEGAGKMIAGDPMNFYLGCDLANDAEQFDFWYSKDNQEFRMAVGFSGGVQVGFPSQVVLYTEA